VAANLFFFYKNIGAWRRETAMDRVLAEFLAKLSEGNGGSPISIEEAEATTKLSRATVLDRFRKLQEHGEGYLKLGRHGHPTRFYLRSKSVAKPVAASNVIAIGPEGQRPVALAADAGRGAMLLATTDEPAKATRRVEMRTHHFHLRADLHVTFELPADLTEREAGRLARYVETLPL